MYNVSYNKNIKTYKNTKTYQSKPSNLNEATAEKAKLGLVILLPTEQSAPP